MRVKEAAYLFVLGVAIAHGSANAGESSGWREIKEFGCHRADGTCFMTIDGPPITGAPGCTSNSVRWDAKTDANGKNWLALVMLAKALNKRIAIYAEGCYSSQPVFPTFAYGYLEG